MLGIEDRVLPKFVRRYAEVGADSIDALRRFSADVRSGAFPAVGSCGYGSGNSSGAQRAMIL